MPTGDLTGWKQVFTDDFTTPTATGSFLTAYGQKWLAYDGFADTDGSGTYSADALSVHDGVLDMHVGDVYGKQTAAAPYPALGGTGDDAGAVGQTYGRYEVRFKTDAIDGVHLAWLLWPDDDSGADKGWDQGEVDFPEADATGTISAFDHCVGNPKTNCFAQNTGVAVASGWHTATIEWTPDGVTYDLDGAQVGTSTTSPSAAMHWVLQTETSGGASTAGDVDVDWVAVWAPS